MNAIDALRTRLRDASRIVVVTGAGVSVASGAPTFRGAGGLWRSFRPEELATPEAFRRDPRLVWEWYDWRRTLIADCRPNAAHDVLAAWTAEGRTTLITQNVDGLHERAGSRDVLRYHGSIWQLRCAGRCGTEWEDLRAPLPALPPACPRCGALARPGVVWFGEPIDPDVAARADAAAARADVFLSIGTSSVVYPAAGLLHRARAAGAFTAEINPVATEAAGELDLAIAMPAEQALPLLSTP